MEAQARAILSAAVAVQGFSTLLAGAGCKLSRRRTPAAGAMSVEDGMIAAICFSRSLELATRNTQDFEGLGLRLIDPWASNV